jgi:hypothetical protein
MERIAYKGWQNCYRMSNGIIDLIATTDVGPRLIRFGFSGDVNEFKEYPDMLGKTGGEEFRLYGGHRLWHAPEARPRTYYPDNVPVTIEQHSEWVRLIQPVENTTGIQKEMDVALSVDAACVRVTHRLRNTNLWAVELAPWALSVMAPGGRVLLPLPPRGSHEANLVPANTLTMWAYTDMSDPRWTWGRKYVMLRQDPQRTEPQKVGLMVPNGWVAYARDGHLLVKLFHHVSGAPYPDWGCSVETFTNAEMLEVETLGPTVTLQPNGAVEHVETWWLYRDVPVPTSDADIDAHVLSKVTRARTAS